MRFVSPGANITFLKSFNSLTGRSGWATISRIYNWAISSPAVFPVFFRSNDTLRLSVFLMAVLLMLILV